MRLFDEDEVGLNEKPEDTYDRSKRSHQNEIRSTGNEGKGLSSQLCHYQELQTCEREGSSLPVGSWEGVKSIVLLVSTHVLKWLYSIAEQLFCWV